MDSHGSLIGEIVALRAKVARMTTALEWYSERAKSLAKKFDPKYPERYAEYSLAIFTELSLDGGEES